MYQWRSSNTFDEYTNEVPLMSDTEELIVRGATAGAVRAVSSGGITVFIEVQASGGAWSRVWSSQLGGGAYSLDGLHIRQPSVPGCQGSSKN